MAGILTPTVKYPATKIKRNEVPRASLPEPLVIGEPSEDDGIRPHSGVVQDRGLFINSEHDYSTSRAPGTRVMPLALFPQLSG